MQIQINLEKVNIISNNEGHLQTMLFAQFFKDSYLIYFNCEGLTSMNLKEISVLQNEHVLNKANH